MSWFTNIFLKTEKRSSLENPSTNLVEWLSSGIRNKSGADVTSSTADSISAAWRSVAVISGDIASFPVGVYEKTDNGKRLLKDHPISKLLKSPSNLYTGFIFREQLAANLAKQGNGIAIIKRDGMGKALALELPTKAIKPIIFKGQLLYEMEGVEVPFFSDDVIHVVGFGDNPIWGKNVIAVHAENLGISLAATDYAATYFGNGGHVGGVLMSERQLTAEQKRDIAGDWKRKYGGDNKNSTAVLDLGFKYQPIGSKPSESQLLEARRFQVEEIARIFGVPLHLLFQLDRATFNNIEVMNAVFVQHTLTMYLERIEAELDKKLLSEKERETLEIRFDMNSLMRGDMGARAAYFNSLFQIAAISPNEIRKAEGLPTYEGGDAYYRPLNMEDVTKINNTTNEGE
jgi:HK97 family phage portal protein